MYKAGVDRRQTALHRGQLRDWIGAGAVHKNDEERRADIIRAMKAVEAELLACTDKSTRKALGLKKLELQQAASAIRPKRKREGMADFICQACKELLPKGTWDAIQLRAARLKKEAEAAAPSESEAA